MAELTNIRLDDIDRQLIAALQVDARESAAMLARKLGIARTTVISRIARLEKSKVITGYGVRLGQRVLEGGLQAYVGITLQPRSGKEVLRRLKRIGRELDSAEKRHGGGVLRRGLRLMIHQRTAGVDGLPHSICRLEAAAGSDNLDELRDMQQGPLC